MGAALKLYNHREGGRFAPGMIANPGGRPRVTPEEREAKRLLREGTIKAARKLLALIDSEDERVAQACAIAVLNYSEVARVEAEASPPDLPVEVRLAAARARTAELEAEMRGKNGEG